MGLDVEAEQHFETLTKVSSAVDDEVALIEVTSYFDEAVFYIEKYLPSGDLRDRCIQLKDEVKSRKISKPQFLREVSQIFSQIQAVNTPIATEHP